MLALLQVHGLSCASFIFLSSFHLLVLSFGIFHLFVIFSSCRIFLKYLDSYVEIRHVFNLFVIFSSSYLSLLSPLFHHYFIFLSCFNTSFEFSLNLSLKLYDLHQNICSKQSCYPQIEDWFHGIYVTDHLVILIKCLFKFEVSREVGYVLKIFILISSKCLYSMKLYVIW